MEPILSCQVQQKQTYLTDPMFQVDIHSHLALLNLGVSDLRAAPERFAPAVVTIPFPQMWGAQVLGYLWC